MTRIDVDFRELRQAASGHWQAKDKVVGDALRRASHLLEFYAVECAMKAHALAERKIYSSKQLTDEFGEDGHDLQLGLKTCRIPAHLGAPPVVCREGGQQVPVSKLHQAWRYGARLEAPGEARFAEWAGKIFDWLNEVKQ